MKASIFPACDVSTIIPGTPFCGRRRFDPGLQSQSLSLCLLKRSRDISVLLQFGVLRGLFSFSFFGLLAGRVAFFRWFSVRSFPLSNRGTCVYFCLVDFIFYVQLFSCFSAGEGYLLSNLRKSSLGGWVSDGRRENGRRAWAHFAAYFLDSLWGW